MWQWEGIWGLTALTLCCPCSYLEVVNPMSDTSFYGIRRRTPPKKQYSRPIAAIYSVYSGGIFFQKIMRRIPADKRMHSYLYISGKEGKIIIINNAQLIDDVSVNIHNQQASLLPLPGTVTIPKKSYCLKTYQLNCPSSFDKMY